MYVVHADSVGMFQDIGDATSVSLLNLDPTEDTPEVMYLYLFIRKNIN